MIKGGCRAARLALYGLAAVHGAQAILLRRRYEGIAALPAVPDMDCGAGEASDLTGDEVVIRSVEGAAIDEATRIAVVREMDAHGTEVVDLLPGDLPAERVLALLKRVDPVRLEAEPLHVPGGVHEAVALRPSVATRMQASGPDGPLSRADLVRQTTALQRYAPGARSLRRAPCLRSARYTSGDRWAELDAQLGLMKPEFTLVPLHLGARLTHLAVLAAGVLTAPLAGVAALVAWSAQPAIVLGRRSVGVSLLRFPLAWGDFTGTVLSGYASYRTARSAAVQRGTSPETATDVPAVEELFEPSLETCAWCGSESLVERLDTPDLLTHKPGTFHLDGCTECGHVFQNPALSPKGLDYYYGQVYEGEKVDVLFERFAGAYERRLEAVAQFTKPRAWLDVGTGRGHFCLAARQRWPDATFDGLDMGEGVEEARRRGWVDTAYQGRFPEVAETMARSYDVVSMYHCLEHTRDPRRELVAAAKVLEPGGYLTIEVPDPASPWSRRLGRWWHCWLQPQHLHFVTCQNLVSELEGTGWEVVSVERSSATTGTELFLGLYRAAGAVAPPAWPWLPEASAVQRVKRQVVLGALLPAFAVTLVVDAVKDARARRPGNQNVSDAYRLVARRP